MQWPVIGDMDDTIVAKYTSIRRRSAVPKQTYIGPDWPLAFHLTHPKVSGCQRLVLPEVDYGNETDLSALPRENAPPPLYDTALLRNTTTTWKSLAGYMCDEMRRGN